MSKVLSFIRNLVFVVMVIAIIGMIYIMSNGKHISVAGYQVLRVLTNSMAPAIADNTCIIIKEVDPSTLKVGDIITFTSDDPAIMGYYNTHRIHEFTEVDGEKMIITKGDASPATDAYPVHMDQVAGIYVRELPGGRALGSMFQALSNNKVYFIFIMLPLAVCLISYFIQICRMILFDDEEEYEEETEESDDTN